jgi:hypothetical protein
MLLSKKSDSVEDLASARPCCFETLPKLCILELQAFNPFRRNLRAAAGSFHSFHSSLRLKCSTAKARQLVAEVTDKLLELVECFDVRTIAV